MDTDTAPPNRSLSPNHHQRDRGGAGVQLWRGFDRGYWLKLARCYLNMGSHESFRACLHKAMAAHSVGGFGFESWIRMEGR